MAGNDADQSGGTKRTFDDAFGADFFSPPRSSSDGRVAQHRNSAARSSRRAVVFDDDDDDPIGGLGRGRLAPTGGTAAGAQPSVLDEEVDEDGWNLTLDEEENLIFDVAYVRWRGKEYYSAQHVDEHDDEDFLGAHEVDTPARPLADQLEASRVQATTDSVAKNSAPPGKDCAAIATSSASSTVTTMAASSADKEPEMKDGSKKVESDGFASPKATRSGKFEDLFPDDDPQVLEEEARGRAKKQLERRASQLCAHIKTPGRTPARTPARTPSRGKTPAGQHHKSETAGRTPLSRSEVRKRLQRHDSAVSTGAPAVVPSETELEGVSGSGSASAAAGAAAKEPDPGHNVEELKIKHKFGLNWLFIRAGDGGSEYAKCGSARKVNDVEYDEENLIAEIAFGPQTGLRRQASGLFDGTPGRGESASTMFGGTPGRARSAAGREQVPGAPLPSGTSASAALSSASSSAAAASREPPRTPARGGRSAEEDLLEIRTPARAGVGTPARSTCQPSDVPPTLTIVFLSSIDFRIFRESMRSKKNPFKDPESEYYLPPETFAEEFRKEQEKQAEKRKRKGVSRVLVKGHTRKGHFVAPHYRKVMTNEGYAKNKSWTKLFD